MYVCGDYNIGKCKIICIPARKSACVGVSRLVSPYWNTISSIRQSVRA